MNPVLFVYVTHWLYSNKMMLLTHVFSTGAEESGACPRGVRCSVLVRRAPGATHPPPKDAGQTVHEQGERGKGGGRCM